MRRLRLLILLILHATACSDGGAHGSALPESEDDGADLLPGDFPGSDADPFDLVADADPDAPDGRDDANGERDCFEALPTPRWSTCGGGLHDPDGRRIRLRGVNVSQPRKLRPYEGGTTPADLAAMRALGLNHVRLLWSWAAAMPEEGALDAAYIERLANEVATLGQAGLLVLLDAHQDLYGEAIRSDTRVVGNGAPAWACPSEVASQFEEPVSPWFANYSHPAVQGCFDHLLADPALQDQFAAAWGAVAARVGGFEHVIGYDLWNEPFWGTHNLNTWEAELLLPLYERLADAILEQDPDAVFFLEPGAQKNVLAFSNLPRADVPELVYAPHLYDVAMESGAAWSGSLSAFRQRLATDRTEAEALGAPLYIGEWGTPGSHAEDVDFAAAVALLLDEVDVGWAIWQWGPGGPGSYALIDGEGNWRPHALALATPWLAAVAGDETSLAIEAETSRTTVSWTARNVAVPTEIVVPELWLGGPFTVDVEGGLVVEGPAGRVSVRAETADTRVVVVLIPTR